MEKLKFFSAIGFVFLFIAANAAEYVTTNLNDRFHTQVTYDKNSDFNIKKLEIRSIGVDMFTTNTTHLTWRGPKKLKVAKVRKISLSGAEVKSLNSISNDMWLARLRPLPSRRDKDNYRDLIYRGLSSIAIDSVGIDNGKFVLDGAKLANLDIDKVKLSNFTVDARTLPSLGILLLDVQGSKVQSLGIKAISTASSRLDGCSLNSLGIGTIAIDTLGISSSGANSYSISPLSLVSLRPGAIQVIDISPESIKLNSMDIANIGGKTIKLDDMTEVKIDDPTHVDVADSYSATVLVIDNSRFNVYWSAETYEELEQMRRAYQYGQSYGGMTSPRMKDFEKIVSQGGNWHLYYKWLNKLWENKTLQIEKVKANGSFKIIGEAWIYSNRWDEAVKEQYVSNLQWTKAKGYNSVLVRFNCTENLTNVLEMVQIAKDNGMKIFSCYVGQDNTCPRWNPYIDPDILEPFFKAVIAESDGYILGWRETSTHVRLLPNEFFNYLCKLAREANPQVLIYGEIYYGQTSSSAGRRALYYNIPANATGVVVQNMGFSGYNHGYIVQRLFRNIVPNYKSYDKLFQVIGIGPYYRTPNGHLGVSIEGLTIEKEYAAKAEVENAFKMYGAKTITMLHDGVDDNYTYYIADPADEKHWNNTTDNLLYDASLTSSK